MNTESEEVALTKTTRHWDE